MLVKSQAKYIQSLGQKKQRDLDGVFIAEGPKIIQDFIDEIPLQIQQVFATDKWIKAKGKLPDSTELIPVTEEELQRISQLTTANQVLAIVKKMVPSPAIDMKGIILALDNIQDPGNLGTLIRIADWFGIEQVICSHDCADMYNTKVVQSSMGSIARVKVFYTDLEALLANQTELKILAAALDGTPIDKVDKVTDTIIIIGNESKGINPQIIKKAHGRITIPRVGKAESLNAAVAAGIILSRIR